MGDRLHAMILGAGRGTRLGSLGATTPKILLDVGGGEPLLAEHLRYLAANDVTDVVLNTHHLSDQVAAYLAEHHPPLPVRLVHEPELLGTAGGVRNALDLLGEREFIVLYGDVIMSPPLGPLLAEHRTSGAELTLTVYAAADATGKGVVKVDGSGRVIGFREKDPIWHGGGLINAGLYVVEPSFFDEVHRGIELDFGSDLLPAAIAEDRLIQAHMLESSALDIGTPDALRGAQTSTIPGREPAS